VISNSFLRIELPRLATNRQYGGLSVNKTPLWVFLAVILGSGIGGILGMIIGVPAASVIYKLLSIDTRKRLSAQNNRLE